MNWQVKKGRLALFAAAGMVLLGAALAYAEGHGEAADPLSHAKLMDLLWRTTNFVALVIVLVKFGSKPIVSALEGRRLGIVQRFDDLTTRRSEVEQSYKKYEEKLGRIDQEVQAILETARAQAELEKQKIIDEANRAAADIKRKAELSVQFELSQAKKTLRDEVAEQAAQMAEALIRKNLTDADQAKLVSEYLDKVGAR
ncbi:MAG: F0F1 ATP synthase subunit B [Desulfobacteraceae bacterium]|nr:F0F1 ATP synthase subunit B [Desulfobacteraceae bacterium]